MFGYHNYQYEVGGIVQVAGCWGKIHRILWRGRIKCQDGYTRKGYLLDDGFWDGYWEEDLESAWYRFEQ